MDVVGAVRTLTACSRLRLDGCQMPSLYLQFLCHIAVPRRYGLLLITDGVRGLSVCHNRKPYKKRRTKCPFPWGIWTPSNTRFLEPIRVLNPNEISIGLAVFAGLTTVTDRQTHDRPTDRPRHSACNNRPHLRRPKNRDLGICKRNSAWVYYALLY